MDPYIFYGTVFPERATLSLHFKIKFGISTQPSSLLSAKIDILLNQIVVWVDVNEPWNLVYLKNAVDQALANYLAIVSFLNGFAYEHRLTRVLNRALEVDHVFGIEAPGVGQMRQGTDVVAGTLELRKLTLGRAGVYISRCLTDLVQAMRSATDAPFYCYRAIEALRIHCAELNDVGDKKGTQWAFFKGYFDCNEAHLNQIKEAADGPRHNDVLSAPPLDHGMVLTNTWTLVDAYFSKLKSLPGAPVEQP